MSKPNKQPGLQSQWHINSDQSIQVGHASKMPVTTRVTQPLDHYHISNSFVLGKNYLLQNNTASELDSSDAESDLSFQERLNCRHQKHVLNQFHKYLQFKGLISTNISFDDFLEAKSSELTKDIEQRVFEEIKSSHGNNGVQRLKLTLKFIKRNENLTRFYIEIIKCIPSGLHTALFLLFQHSVVVYLEGRQAIAGEEKYMSELLIKEYLSKNVERICQELAKEEKVQTLFNPQKEQMLRRKFMELVSEWMEGFFLAKEGYACVGYSEAKKKSHPRVGMRQGETEREGRKKIKKF